MGAKCRPPWLYDRIHHAASFTAPRSLLRDYSYNSILTQEVNSFLQWGVIDRVSLEYHGTVFYSIYFLIPEKKGGRRLILDLRLFSHFIRKPKFRMATLAAIIPSLEKGMWALNMQDTLT